MQPGPAAGRIQGDGLELASSPQPLERVDVVRLARDLVALARIHWLPILLCIAVCAALAVVVTLLSDVVYRAKGTLQIDPDQRQIVSVDDVADDNVVAESLAYYQTQYGILRSRTLAQRVVNAVGVNRILGEEVPEDVDAARRAAVGQLSRELTIRPVPNSRLVEVSYDSMDPGLAAEVVNAHMNQYIQMHTERKFEATAYAREFLGKRLEELRGRLEESERQLVTYAEEADLVVGPGGSPDSGAAKELESLVAARADATRARIEAEKKVDALRGTDPSSHNDDNPMVNALLVDLGKARSDLAALSATYGPDYPTVIQLRNRIASVERQIAAESRQLANGKLREAQAEAEAAREAEQELGRKIAELRDAARSADRRSIDYNILRRELDTNKSLYDAILERFREIGGAASGVTTVSIVDSAIVPRAAIAPRPIVNLGFGILAGLVAAVLVVMILENWRKTVRNPEILANDIRAPVLGVIPKFGATSELKGETAILQFMSDMRSAPVEAYLSVKTAIEFARATGRPRSLVFTSTRPSEGKTTSAIATATLFARSGVNVLLIDGDLRKPSLHRVFSLRNNIGFRQLIQGEVEHDAMGSLYEDGKLRVIPAGATSADAAAELMDAQVLVALVSKLEGIYDMVVIDAPPVLGLADAPVLARIAEATVFVVSSEGSNSYATQRAVDRIRAAGANVIGGILTKFDHRRETYMGYDYESSYSEYGYGASYRADAR